MSRFEFYEYEEEYNNAAELWQANTKRALAGKKGRKALAELREALLALPEKKLISGALCTVGGMDRIDPARDRYGDQAYGLDAKLATEGEGVCAIGAYLWFKKVKAGMDPQEAFLDLPLLLDSDGEAGIATADAGHRAGLTFVLAWELAYRNDGIWEAMTPEERYVAFMAWIDGKLA